MSMSYDDALGHLRHWGEQLDTLPNVFVDVCNAVVEEVERLQTWDGMLSILNLHWPPSLVPTTHQTDEPKRDPGARIVSLIRWVEEQQAEVKRLRREAATASTRKGIRD